MAGVRWTAGRHRGRTLGVRERCNIIHRQGTLAANQWKSFWRYQDFSGQARQQAPRGRLTQNYLEKHIRHRARVKYAFFFLLKSCNGRRGSVRVSGFPHLLPQNNRQPRLLRGPGREKRIIHHHGRRAIAWQRHATCSSATQNHCCTRAMAPSRQQRRATGGVLTLVAGACVRSYVRLPVPVCRGKSLLREIYTTNVFPPHKKRQTTIILGGS